MEMTAVKKAQATKLLPTKNEGRKKMEKSKLKNAIAPKKVNNPKVIHQNTVKRHNGNTKTVGNRTNSTAVKKLRQQKKAKPSSKTFTMRSIKSKLNMFLKANTILDNSEYRQMLMDDLYQDEEYLKVQMILKRKRRKQKSEESYQENKDVTRKLEIFAFGGGLLLALICGLMRTESTEPRISRETLDEAIIGYYLENSEYVNENALYEKNALKIVQGGSENNYTVETANFKGEIEPDLSKMEKEVVSNSQTSNSNTLEQIYAENAEELLAPLEYTEEDFELFYSVAYGECGAETDKCKIATMEEIKYGIIKRGDGDFADEIRFPARYSCVMEDGRILCGQGIVTPEIVPEEFKQMARDVLDGKYEDTIKFMSSYLAWGLMHDKNQKKFTSAEAFAQYYGILEYVVEGPHIFFYEEEWPEELV